METAPLAFGPSPSAWAPSQIGTEVMTVALMSSSHSLYKKFLLSSDPQRNSEQSNLGKLEPCCLPTRQFLKQILIGHHAP